MSEVNFCPKCGSDQRDPDSHYSRTIMVEIQGVYDGGLFFQCPFCGAQWHRWGDPEMRAKASKYMTEEVL